MGTLEIFGCCLYQVHSSIKNKTSHTHFVIATYGESLTISTAIGAFLTYPIALRRISLHCTVLHKSSHLLVHQSFINTMPSVIAATSEAAKEQGEKGWVKPGFVVSRQEDVGNCEMRMNIGQHKQFQLATHNEFSEFQPKLPFWCHQPEERVPWEYNFHLCLCRCPALMGCSESSHTSNNIMCFEK